MCSLVESRTKIRVQGVVQGVGFRPFIFNLAKEHQLKGWVTNDSLGVLIEVEGTVGQIAVFLRDISSRVPPLAQIDTIKTMTIPLRRDNDFVIKNTDRLKKAQTLISPDMAICSDCLRELLDPENTRYLYPFINCTNCGPRFTIIKAIPYDRPFTTMGEFNMCSECQKEYVDQGDRRFHAQPNACPVCGPRIYLTDHRGQELICSDLTEVASREGNPVWPEWAMPAVSLRELLTQGKIAGVKGLGGYHLVCDARNQESVQALRKRKHRPNKPLAVMMPDLETVKQYCQVTPAEERLLLSPSRPIVLLKWLAKGDDGITTELARLEKRLGVMLPYTPLHYMLFDSRLKVLVVTSGNFSGEPIIYQDQEAISRLGGVVDYFLLHNRQIIRPCDDSVQRVDKEPIMLRRSRGYAPLPLKIASLGEQNILACGGELKNTFALTRKDQVFLSQHIGDLKTRSSYHLYQRLIDELIALLEVEPEIIAYDLHPGYLSTKYAQKRYREKKRIGVQHHHAHIASCLAEYNLTQNVIGIAFDGTGYGTDGKIWGGEILIASPEKFQRFAHLKYLPLPGGEKAIMEPWRIGAGYLEKAMVEEKWIYDLPLWQDVDISQWYRLQELLKQGNQSPESSSMGRLFDAVSAICGVRGEVTFEGQAAIYLEELAEEELAPVDQVYSYTICFTGLCYEIDPLPMIARIAQEIYQGRKVKEVAQCFHSTIVDIAYRSAILAREIHHLETVVLGGGVFQNRLLSLALQRRLELAGFAVYLPHLIPVNDGGLALGQIYVANHQEKCFGR